jgi:hypothetical protein
MMTSYPYRALFAVVLVTCLATCGWAAVPTTPSANQDRTVVIQSVAKALKDLQPKALEVQARLARLGAADAELAKVLAGDKVDYELAAAAAGTAAGAAGEVSRLATDNARTISQLRAKYRQQVPATRPAPPSLATTFDQALSEAARAAAAAKQTGSDTEIAVARKEMGLLLALQAIAASADVQANGGLDGRVEDTLTTLDDALLMRWAQYQEVALRATAAERRYAGTQTAMLQLGALAAVQEAIGELAEAAAGWGEALAGLERQANKEIEAMARLLQSDGPAVPALEVPISEADIDAAIERYLKPGGAAPQDVGRGATPTFIFRK